MGAEGESRHDRIEMNAASGAIIGGNGLRTIPFWVVICAWVWLCPCRPVFASEPRQEFFDSLLDHRYFELADYYLDRTAEDSRAEEPFKNAIPYLRAKVRFASIATLPDLPRRLEALQKMDTMLAAYRGPVGTGELPTAPLQLRQDGLLLRARLLSRSYAQAPPANRSAETLKDLEATYATITALAKELESELKAFLEAQKSQSPEHQDIKLRDTARDMYIEAQACEPRVKFERAKLLSDSPESRSTRDKLLKEAATGFQELMNKYASRDSQYYFSFLIQSARCHRLLGDLPEAMSRYTEILELEGAPPVASGIATAEMMEIWQHDPKKNGKAIPAGEAWLQSQTGGESEILGPVQVALANALLDAASEEAPTIAARTKRRARELLTSAAKGRGEAGDEARTRLAELPPLEEGALADAKAFTTFADAFLEAENAIGRMQSATTGADLLQEQLQDTQDATRRQELQAEIDVSRTEIANNRKEAIRYLRRARDLMTPEQTPEQRLQSQFLLGYLMFTEGNFYDSAVLCESLARRHPTASQARSAARTALAAYARLMELEPADDFGKRHVLEMSRFAAEQWPEDDEGRDAMLTSVRMLVSMGQLQEAQRFLGQLPADSQVRPEGELTMGTALYREYVARRSTTMTETSKAEPGKVEPGKAADSPPSTQQLPPTELLNEAKGMLESGLRNWGKQPPTIASILAVLSLASIHLEQGEVATATELLRREPDGPLRLLEQHAPTMETPGLAEETYRLALKTHFAAMVSSNAGSLPAVGAGVKELDALMAGLRQATGDTPEGQRRLVANYVTIARDLKAHVAAASPERRPSIADGFESVMNQIGESTRDPQISPWIAQTLMELAELFVLPDGTPDLRAKKYLAAADARITASLAALPPQADAGERLALRMRLATVKRKQQDYRGAMELFADILRERNQLLNVQVEAATTYQEGGAFDYAIKGGRPEKGTGKNIIWGWERINHVMSREIRGQANHAEYTRLFHESRLQIAACRFAQAKQADASKREELLRRAERAILSTRTFDPTFGGPARREEYQSLLLQIQTELGKPAIGLEGGDDAPTQSKG